MTMPRITIMLVVIVVVAYFVGAKFPVLAQKVGLA
jgi:hypothetical protein